MIKLLLYQIPRDKAEGHLYSYFSPHLSHHITSSVGVKWNTNRVDDLIKWPSAAPADPDTALVFLYFGWILFTQQCHIWNLKQNFTKQVLSAVIRMTILILRTVQDINNLRTFWLKKNQDNPRWQTFELKIQIFLF